MLERKKNGKNPLDPNDAMEILRVYERMISNGDRTAIWHWHVFENNLMEFDPHNLLDPNVIVEEKFPMAQSVAFFETRLWTHSALEVPSRLLERVDRLESIPVWICQGKQDEVCPAGNAGQLVNALEKVDLPLTVHFLNAGHEDTDPVIEKCLRRSMVEFEEYYFEQLANNHVN